MTRFALLFVALVGSPADTTYVQSCSAGAAPSQEQMARRRDGVRVARTINNLEANQPGAKNRKFLAQAELPASPFASAQTGAQAEFFRQLDFTPGKEVMPGWTLTLDVTADGYWFLLRDKSDPCGFSLVSNHTGLIFEAQPLR